MESDANLISFNNYIIDYNLILTKLIDKGVVKINKNKNKKQPIKAVFNFE